MPGETVILGLVVATIFVTYVLIRLYTGAVRTYFFEPIEQARLVLGLLILSVGAWTALNSGVPYLMAAALGGIAFVTAYIYYEEPHNEIR